MSAPPLLPGSTIGVIGGGQLGRMLALEARRMGYRVAVLDPQANGPAAQVSDEHLAAPLDDLDATRELARRSQVVTLEWENADVNALREIEGEVPLRPAPHVLAVAQHRLREKETAGRVGLPTPRYRRITRAEELREALRETGVPAVLKTVRGGYDGRGQAVIRRAEEAAAAHTTLSALEPELILEQWIDFRMEISVICARTPAGEVATYPIGENIHREGILEASRVPAALPPALGAEARRMGEALTEDLRVEGLLAIEMFVGRDDRLYVNEIAPRPHNSGHYTWEACATSQFEQHLRAIAGLPLGSTELLRPAAMVNLLGDEIGTGEGLATWAAALAGGAVTLHLYGKREARPRRKMGHLTALADDPGEALERARRAREILIDRG